MADDLVVGAIFSGRYRIERRIAAGGMGAVYEVTHLETSRRCALKVMHPDLVQNEESRGRFRQEAQVTAQIESEYIVDVFDAGIDEPTGVPYLVMELLQGEEIAKRIKRLERLSPHDTVLYLHQAALALEKTHRARIVHRDLKPDNLFLCERDDGPPRIKLLDFGIAKIVAANSASANATQAVGTPLYMAPEQFLMDSMVSAATDLYALAMIAYTMLVGQAYWFEESKKGANVFAFAVHATMGPQEIPSARALRNGVTLPPTFDEWFVKATARKPEERFQNAMPMIAALADAFGLPPPAVILANAYAQGTGHSISLLPPEGDYGGRTAAMSSASLLGSVQSTKHPPEAKRPMVAVMGIVLSVLILIGLGYSAFSGPTAEYKSPAVAADSTASAIGLPEIVPIAPIGTPIPTQTSTAQAPPESAPSSVKTASLPRSGPAPAPQTTTTPISTTKTKKGKWIRD